jgi:DNA replicative helicase MCM subunit Mcm2 (Cdc46/Mcm family)
MNSCSFSLTEHYCLLTVSTTANPTAFTLLHAGQMVALRGMVIRSSAIIPDLKQAFFRCIVCGDVREVMIDRGRIDEPGICLGCGTRNAHEVIHNRCMFTDKQVSSVSFYYYYHYYYCYKCCCYCRLQW